MWPQVHYQLPRPTLVQNYSFLHFFWVHLPFCIVGCNSQKSIKWRDCHLWNSLTPFWMTKGPHDEIDLTFFETMAHWNLNSDSDSARQDMSKNTPLTFFPWLLGSSQFFDVNALTLTMIRSDYSWFHKSPFSWADLHQIINCLSWSWLLICYLPV